MANQCKGCQWAKDLKVFESKAKRVPYACSECKATCKGGSNYVKPYAKS